jgi:hypothetical protein
MDIITQNYQQLLSNIIKDSFNNSINNYMDIMTFFDSAFSKLIKEAIIKTFELIDKSYKDSFERKQKYHIKAYSKRSLFTIFGKITFSRTYYSSISDNSTFCYLDRFLGLPKYDFFDPYIKAIILENAAKSSYSKISDIIYNSAGIRVFFANDKPELKISRQTIRNIILRSKSLKSTTKYLGSHSTIYVMADEKYVHTQNNENKDIQVKAATIFTDYSDMPGHRRSLVNKHYITSTKSSSDIWNKVVDYIYTATDIDAIEDIIIMGDGANWIKAGQYHLKLNSDASTTVVLDHFHLKQAIKHISSDKDYRASALHFLKYNDINGLKKLEEHLIELEPHREEILIKKFKYLYNNWGSIQNLFNNPNYKCSMESHISHVIADLFTSRPKGYSPTMLNKLLELRLLYKNSHNIKELFLSSLDSKPKNTTSNKSDKVSFKIFEELSNSIPILKCSAMNTTYNTLYSIAYS